MNFYLDENLAPAIAAIARMRYALVARSSHDVAMNGTTDDEQLAYATEQQLCIVTKNRDDFIALDRHYREHGVVHTGILITAPSLLHRPARRIDVEHECTPVS